jgi:hypothetical protein
MAVSALSQYPYARTISYDAHSVARRWLLELLTPTQAAQFSVYSAFVVPGKRRNYVIEASNYHKHVTDDRGISYCIGARGYGKNNRHVTFCGYDEAIGLLLLIRTNERKFRRITFIVPFSRRSFPVHPLLQKDERGAHHPLFLKRI